MKQYAVLEHTGDFKIRVWAKTKEELFLNAMLGMIAGLRPEIRSTKSEIRNIKVKSLDLNALLVDFLNEILYLIQTNKEVYDKIKFKKFSDTGLEAGLSGHKVDIFGEDIKAVTYHGLDIRKNKDGLFEATVLFDV
ncbi:MAG: archease [Candidatus Nealsonbacteria bacterium]|nr:archease [Candidatus Nealsonbacteria bacterium]